MRYCKCFLVLAFLILFGAVSLQAQRVETMSLNVYPLSPLRSGDVIKIRVANVRGVVEIDQEFSVNETGNIDIPLLGFVKVSGKNTPELEKHLTKLLSDKALKSPRVSVAIERMVLTDKVFVFGGIKNPGTIDMRDSISVLDAIKQAGGFSDVTMSGGWAHGGTTGTDLFNPKANQVAFQPSQSLDHLANTKVKRSGKEISVNIKKLIMEGDISQNIQLTNNDVLFIPRPSDAVAKSDESIYILGAVVAPARYRYRENMSVLDAISVAGGLENKHSIKFATIIRGMKEASTNKKMKPNLINIDLRKLIFRGDFTADKILQSGDLLLVSTRQYRNVLSDLGQFVDNFIPFLKRMDQVVGYDDSIRSFNERFLK